jgi:hypothetical protein
MSEPVKPKALSFDTNGFAHVKEKWVRSSVIKKIWMILFAPSYLAWGYLGKSKIVYWVVLLATVFFYIGRINPDQYEMGKSAFEAGKYDIAARHFYLVNPEHKEYDRAKELAILSEQKADEEMKKLAHQLEEMSKRFGESNQSTEEDTDANDNKKNAVGVSLKYKDLDPIIGSRAFEYLDSLSNKMNGKKMFYNVYSSRFLSVLAENIDSLNTLKTEFSKEKLMTFSENLRNKTDLQLSNFFKKEEGKRIMALAIDDYRGVRKTEFRVGPFKLKDYDINEKAFFVEPDRGEKYDPPRMSGYILPTSVERHKYQYSSYSLMKLRATEEIAGELENRGLVWMVVSPNTTTVAWSTMKNDYKNAPEMKVKKILIEVPQEEKVYEYMKGKYVLYR